MLRHSAHLTMPPSLSPETPETEHAGLGNGDHAPMVQRATRSRSAFETAELAGPALGGRATGVEADADALVQLGEEIPLGAIPRPALTGVAITGDGAMSLGPPLQRTVGRALGAALYQVLRKSLRSHPDFEAPGPVQIQMRRDHDARWLLPAGLIGVCAARPGIQWATESRSVVRRDPPGAALTGLSDDERFVPLDQLAGISVRVGGEQDQIRHRRAPRRPHELNRCQWVRGI